MATELTTATVPDTDPAADASSDAPPVKASKSVTMDAPSQQAIVSLSEVQLGSRKTTNKSSMSRTSQVSRPDGFIAVGQRPSVRLIDSSHRITAEWLTEVYEMRGFLQPGGKVSSCNVKPLGEGEGVMGVLAICNVELENGMPHAPKQFVAKFSPVRLSPKPKPLPHHVAALCPTSPRSRSHPRPSSTLPL